MKTVSSVLRVALLAIVFFPFSRALAQPAGDSATVDGLVDEFSGETVDAGLWQVTRKNDFQESTVDIVQGRLRLRAATLGTKDDTVKYHGLRSLELIRLKQPMELSFDLDWNDQRNGCYLTAGVVLCPTKTDANPEEERDWLKFEYIGVPPGRNARAWISARSKGGERVLYNEGWPDKQRTGRKIGRQKLRILWKDDALSVMENGRLLWQTPWKGFDFPSAYLYLQMSSHSNYAPREIFFDAVKVTTAKG
ncbi:MAG: hypothetical protein HY318_09595 [Armatimonadetes bacterium]|nr:hypothetical protein [Armatimonadota bacterium]